MILQSLINYYDTLLESGEKVASIGWSSAKVSMALEIDADGQLRNIVPLKVKSKDGKKEIPQIMNVPEQVKKSSGIISNFLCENGQYFLGYDIKNKPERTAECFESAKKLHEKILGDSDISSAKAVVAFFENWDISKVQDNPIVVKHKNLIEEGGNIVFKFKNQYVQDDERIKETWEEYFSKKKEGKASICLLTGEKGSMARLHPNISGVVGAQSSGASLVSYNEQAFESFGHVQGENAQVSEKSAFKYATSLNYLLSEGKENHVQRFADTTIVFWADNARNDNETLFMNMIFGKQIDSKQLLDEKDIKDFLKKIKNGEHPKYDKREIDPESEFFILGLAPNAARLSVSLFLHNNFGKMIENANNHSERLIIKRPVYEKNDKLPFWKLLDEVSNQKLKDKKVSPSMANATFAAIINDTPYPASLYENVIIRIKKEREISWKKAAIIKAYIIKNEKNSIIKEVASVELNEKSEYLPYILGRMFAVLEKAQMDSSPGIKATIKDKYFTSACSNPSAIFPLLIRLSQHHQRKLGEGSKRYYDGMIEKLHNKIHEELPAHFDLKEQGAFYLGYYHQRQDLYTSKESKEEK